MKTTTVTEQETIDVDFRIIELLTIYELLDDSKECHPNDRYMTATIEYLKDKIFAQLPDWKESDAYYKGILYQDEHAREFYNKYIK